MFKRNQSGQSLLEVVAALAAALLVILGLVRVTIVSMRNSQMAKNQALATQYAQEAMEKIRAYRDQNSWEIFWDDMDDLSSGPTDIDTLFSKTVLVENAETSPGAADRAKVTVTVSWESGRHQSEIVSYLTKWE